MKRVNGVEYEHGEVKRIMVSGIDVEEPEKSYPFDRVVIAHWICGEDMYENGVCSHCHRDCGEKYEYVDYPRCPYCGAYMTEKVEE